MQITVTGKQIDIGDAFRQHAEDNLSDAVSKYFDNAVDASVTLSKAPHHHHRVDVSVHVGRGVHVQAHGEAEDPYAALEAGLERVAKRLRRNKRRLRDHHRKEASHEQKAELIAQQYVLAAPNETEDDLPAETEDGAPVIIAEATTEVVKLTVGDAVMRLDLTDSPALVFKNAAHGRLNVIYRRADGNIGWLDPADNENAA